MIVRRFCGDEQCRAPGLSPLAQLYPSFSSRTSCGASPSGEGEGRKGRLLVRPLPCCSWSSSRTRRLSVLTSEDSCSTLVLRLCITSIACIGHREGGGTMWCRLAGWTLSACSLGSDAEEVGRHTHTAQVAFATQPLCPPGPAALCCRARCCRLSIP